jgi:thiol reductant ABC exporter CydD subunit
VTVLGPDGLVVAPTGDVATLATRGIDALDGYYALYLPQLLLAVIAPLLVLAVVLAKDWVSALIIAGTLPLIPLFMALVGASTRDQMNRQLVALERLAGHFLDVVAGLPTLKVFGRAKAQAAAIWEVTDRYRSVAMSTLRISFLSSLILELVATVSVALVAVAIGLRLLNGDMDLRTGLFVLVLAPEAYLPLRQLDTNYHASAEGVAAAEQVFGVLEQPVPEGRAGDASPPDPARVPIVVEGVSVTYPDREQPALEGITLTIEPGETVALTGPSGCGKSTLLGVLLGLIAPQKGTVHVGEVALCELDPDEWRSRLAWVPQRPYLFAESVADNVRLGRGEASDDEVWEALEAVGLGPVIRELPDGIETMLGERGAGLSTGERQRLALARAFLREVPLILVDEPTANLDGRAEDEVIEAVRRLCVRRTAVIVAHRPALLGMADRVVTLESAGVAT